MVDAVARCLPGEFVQIRGEPYKVLKTLKEGPLGSHAGAQTALAELDTLFSYLDAMDCLHCISFDMSLARGLDYYTGAIYEAVLKDDQLGVGSISAGGRYDNLVGMFSPKQIPCVGVSIGVERVFAILEHRAKEAETLKTRPVDVYVAAAPGGDSSVERVRLAQLLWSK